MARPKAPIFEIERIGAKGARDPRYAIIWAKLAGPGGTAAAPPAAVKHGRGRKRRPASDRGSPAVRSSSSRHSRNAELDAAAAAGIMPEKPIVTSQANTRGQKRFDFLAERAAAGDWTAVKAYVIKSFNSPLFDPSLRLTLPFRSQVAGTMRHAGQGVHILRRCHADVF